MMWSLEYRIRNKEWKMPLICMTLKMQMYIFPSRRAKKKMILCKIMGTPWVDGFGLYMKRPWVHETTLHAPTVIESCPRWGHRHLLNHDLFATDDVDTALSGHAVETTTVEGVPLNIEH